MKKIRIADITSMTSKELILMPNLRE